MVVIYLNKKMRVLFTYVLLANLLICCNGNAKQPEEENINIELNKGIPVKINYAVINSFPHDTSLFTEGFLIHDGKLYESTGSPENLLNTRSVICTDDLNTGKIDKKVEIDKSKYFGEGIVFLRDKLYQITYKNQLGFIYNATTYKQIGKFKFSNLEGWGLTTNGVELIMSDGTDILTFLSPDNLKPVRSLRVTESGLPLISLNELEYIKGFIYANVWNTNNIVKVDPTSGRVVGTLDLSSINNEAKYRNPRADVLNGIAFDSTSDKIFITGKLWSNIYQINFAH